VLEDRRAGLREATAPCGLRRRTPHHSGHRAEQTAQPAASRSVLSAAEQPTQQTAEVDLGVIALHRVMQCRGALGRGAVAAQRTEQRRQRHLHGSLGLFRAGADRLTEALQRAGIQRAGKLFQDVHAGSFSRGTSGGT
jgi:hypothetical protein